MGPMVSEEIRQNVVEQVKDAVKHGARLILGGKPVKNEKGYYFEPTLLTNLSH